jgi:IS5 family transposase
VLTRTLRRIGARVRERTRSVARRVFEIAQRSRTAGGRVRPAVRERSKARMKVLYQGLMGITRAVVRQAEAAVARARGRHHAAQLSATIELVRQVLAQTRARVLRGNTHYPGKVVSLFEPHSEIIRKGKLAKPTEFGRLVKIQEAEAQFITDYAVGERGQSERALWGPALDRHIALFDRAPQLAVADGGFASRANERPRRTAGSGTSCCRGSRASSALALPAQPSAGARGAKAGSVRLSAVMGSGGAGTAARAGCSAGSGSASSPITCWCSAAPGHESRETSDGPPSARCMEQILK